MKTSPTSSAQRVPRFTPASATFLSLALLLSGCTTMQIVPPSSLVNLTSAVQVGDQADCTLTDGTHVQFKVTAVEPAALVGDTHRVATAEIVHLELKRFDAVKTFGAIAVVAGAAALGVSTAHKAENGINIGFLGK